MSADARQPGPIARRLIEHTLHGPGKGLPERARDRAAIFIEDSLLVGLSARALPERAGLLAALDPAGPITGGARPIGASRRISPADAALLSGFSIHGQEFDCVHEPAVVHPMAVIGAVLLSHADERATRGRPVSGRELIEAVAVAVDTATVLGMMAVAPMRFFRPAMCGALGAALGLARLARLDEQQSAALLGLTLCQLSGSMQAHIEGTAGLALQVGFNARNVITALALVERGLSGPLDAIDGPFGYLSLFEQDFDPGPLSQLGQDWQIERVSHKPWPTGRAAQGALDALESMLAEGLEADAIARISLAAPPLVRRLVDRPWRTGSAPQYARLCLPWLLSVTLARGRVSLDDFDANALADPARAARAGDIAVIANEVEDPNALLPQRLIVELCNGSRIERPIEAVLGSPERPLDAPGRRAKARTCAAHAGLEPERTEALLARLADLATLADVSELLDLMELP